MKRLAEGSFVPVAVVVLAIIAIWYAGTIILNTPWQQSVYARADLVDVPLTQFLADVFAQQRPVLPAPHQVAVEFYNSVFNANPSTPRSLIFHAWITLSATGLGFIFGTLLGIGLAVLIVHNRAMDRSLMPWIIASQTIPILAIAPMVVVVLNSVGLTGLIPKALISTYLSFFPVVVGMVKGFRSPEAIHLDLMRTYNASGNQVFWKLRWPAAVPYLFTSMKVGVAASLVGAIVGELPTGAAGGLGSRLLAGSYYGQTTQIWAALLMAAALSAALIFAIGAIQSLTAKMMGAPA
ncbi:ABC transporter permease [Pelagibacterium halotolerans]|uniref:Pyrimidine ABC transporter, transmembrane component 1 n=1 Tax=Pelagibacterium halotolerans (strain DSM 22347 / JCM 15775 / CGMCC 1.7692 / B2) TaxID=1082931 RepID=G4R7G6_PELHB|nr:ABC transporter permease [Pelagibacterium halotolerans]AEQ52267.1 pyrimidine ABC transporter, transmembrane component 1 [Pelagibacterium halotolerans B2]QJR17984.1 ABC transporter permease [Pelagibacterium halotolerans]SEA31551.1 NitT/TauT family transport system permease protein [Pelagibacterium halotolerans]